MIAAVSELNSVVKDCFETFEIDFYSFRIQLQINVLHQIEFLEAQ